MAHAALNLLLVEDDELFRLGLRVRLQQAQEIQQILEAEDGETALVIAQQTPLDVVLLDIGLPGIGGIETCHQLKQNHPELPILILTSHNDPALLQRLIQSDAQGYCLKGIAAETLMLAIRSVTTGASWWDATATKAIRHSVMTSSGPSDSAALPQNPLTQREQEVLALIAAGKTNNDIAQRLYISSGTVRVHVHSILHKLTASDRGQAVHLAQQQGWLRS